MITPQTEEKFLAQALGVPRIFLKREDLHPYGSHKGRSIPHMIDLAIKNGTKSFAISGSGNASISAAMHITRLMNKGQELLLDIFIGEKINTEKKECIQKFTTNKNIIVHQVSRPIQSLHQLCTDDDSIKSLRQSTDDSALTGYYDVAEELTNIPDISAVFIPTSSGTTAQALHEYFRVHKKDIPIHIVQTTSCHPLALEFDMPETSEQSLATAIVDITARRKMPVAHAIKDSNGNGWVATNSDIQKAQDILKKYAQVDATPNGALGVAGLLRAISKGKEFTGTVVCMVTGK